MSVTIEKLKEVLSKTSNKSILEISESESLRDQGIDSLDIMDLFFNIEEEFNLQIPDADVEKLTSLKDIENYIDSK